MAVNHDLGVFVLETEKSHQLVAARLYLNRLGHFGLGAGARGGQGRQYQQYPQHRLLQCP
jgi:hypothetical protein